jgi:uncharacterized protein with von Willebrand factor type A (vWA) domain
MDIFDKRVRNNFDIMKNIWINYPETRLKREFIAKNWWMALYEGKSPQEAKGFLEETMEVLSIFKDMTIGNEILCNKLIGDYFAKVKEKYDHEIYGEMVGEKKRLMDLFIKSEIKSLLQDSDGRMENIFLEESEYKAYRKKVEKYREMWKDIQGEVTDHFQLEYDKMKKMRDILGDSMMDKMGWDLSRVDKKTLFDLGELDRLALEDEKLNYLLNMLGKKEKKKNLDLDMSEIQNSPNKKELLGVHLSNDLVRLLPSELSLMHNEHLRRYFHAKYIENRLSTYLLSDMDEDLNPGDKNNEDAQGPIILCIDTSSSMKGLPERLAKASTLFLLKKAQKKGRKIYIIAFSGEGSLREFEVAQSSDGIEGALEFFNWEFYGGTDYLTPMTRCIELIEKKGYVKSDVLMISDGIVEVSDEFIEYIERIKKRFKFKIYSLIISSKNVKNLFSDKILYYEYKKKMDANRSSEYQFYNRSFLSNHG